MSLVSAMIGAVKYATIFLHHLLPYGRYGKQFDFSCYTLLLLGLLEGRSNFSEHWLPKKIRADNA